MTGGISALSFASSASLALLGCLAGLLLIAAISDLKSREIPNLLNLAIALSAPLFWWAQGLQFWPDMVIQIAAALAVFGVFAGLFAVGAIGGGDVKMIGALALWIDASLLLALLQIMALVGGLIAGSMLISRKINKSSGIAEVPYGVAIAVAGFWAIHEHYINQLTAIPIT